ncbi:MAG: cupin domain-containing protein [Mesorhizobium sp.]
MSPTLIRFEGDGAFGEPTPVARPTSDQVAMVRVAADQPIPVGTTGFWECTPGRFRRGVPQAEYSYFITGKGTFTPDGGETVRFQAGDAIYFPANSRGEWNILETVRKAYVIFE